MLRMTLDIERQDYKMVGEATRSQEEGPMSKRYRPLKNFTRRLPTATFGNYRPKGRHTKLSLAWLVAARKLPG